MGAAFKYHGALFWTSNSVVEHLLTEATALAERRHGTDHEVARWLRQQSEGFYSGMVVFIEFKESEHLSVLGKVFGSVADEALARGEFGPLGVEWLEREFQPLVRWLGGGPPFVPQPRSSRIDAAPWALAASTGGGREARPGAWYRRPRVVLAAYSVGAFVIAAVLYAGDAPGVGTLMIARLLVMLGLAAAWRAAFPELRF